MQPKLLTTTEAAAFLTERGFTDRDGGPVRRDTVKHWCQAGKIPGAVKTQPGKRGEWQIPLASLQDWTPTRKGRSDKGKARRKVGIRVRY